MSRYLSILSGALLSVFLLTGCGYKVGFVKHPQLDSIAVAPVINETEIYNASSDVRMLMSEVIMQDGTFKLGDMRRADAILYMTVENIAFAEASRASVKNKLEYRPEEWRVRVDISYKLIVPGQGKPLRSGKVDGDVRFQAGADVENGRLRAVRQACFMAARNIIYAIAEGW